MADDFLNQALAQIAQQSLAQNPYAQFGSVLSQQKNPYITAEDPWSGIAASAAQGFLGGLSSGYGQAQVKRQMQEITPLIPQLYADPMSVKVGDSDILSHLQRQALAQQAANQHKLKQVGLEEFAKFKGNPLLQMQENKAALDFAQQMSDVLGVPAEEAYAALKGIKTNKTNPATGAASQPLAQAPGQTPSADQVFKGPTVVPTQAVQAQAQAPAGRAMEMPVPDITALTEKFRQGGKVPYAKAAEAAQAEYKRIMDANKDLQIESVKQAGKVSEQKEAARLDQESKFNDMLKAKTEALNTLDRDIATLELAGPNLPDYGDPLLGGASKLWDELASRRGYLGGFSEQSKKNLAAASAVASVAPAVAGKLLKEAALNPVTENELGFVLTGFPGENKTKEQNQTIIKTLKIGRDMLKFENAFTRFYKNKGLSSVEINQKLERERAALGGSFLKNGTLHPDLIQATQTLNSILGGSL